MRTKILKCDSVSACVFFGYNTAEIDEVGYFGKNLDIVEDVKDAKVFPLKKSKWQRGFGTPEQWLEYVNSDADLNHGYKFHIVKMNI